MLNKKKEYSFRQVVYYPAEFHYHSRSIIHGLGSFFRAGPEISHLSCMQVEKEILPKAAKFQAEIKKQMKLLRCQVGSNPVSTPDPKGTLPGHALTRKWPACPNQLPTAIFWEDAGRKIIIVSPLFRLSLVVFCICCDWMSVAASFASFSHARWFVFYALNDATLQEIHERKNKEKRNSQARSRVLNNLWRDNAKFFLIHEENTHPGIMH